MTLPDESPVTAAGCSGHVHLFCCQLSQCSRLVTPSTIQTSILCMLLVLLQKPQPFQGSGILGSIWVEQPGDTQSLGFDLCVSLCRGEGRAGVLQVSFGRCIGGSGTSLSHSRFSRAVSRLAGIAHGMPLAVGCCSVPCRHYT